MDRSVDGVDIHWAELGAGVPLVALHGASFRGAMALADLHARAMPT
ncbi:hypothetical protein [Microbacterium protaetiae]|nr:hypothetical protein [Microbacterium protaetiae]